MVAVRNHRIGSAVLAESPPRVSASRESIEIVADDGGAQQINLHRVSVSVLAKSSKLVAVQRESFEAAVPEGGAQQINLHSLGSAGFAKSLPKVGVQRESFEAVADEGGTQDIRLHRLAISILGRATLPPPEPLPLAASLDFFMHNWAEKVVIETAYQTDVFRSKSTGAEERPSRTQRPDRLIEIYWLRSGDTEVRALLKLLRRLTKENVQIPLYPDVVDVDSALTSNDDTIQCNTRSRRFFVGARVLLFPKNQSIVTADEAMIRTIESLTATSLTFTQDHGVAVAANTLAVVPLLDCEIVLEPSANMLTDLVGEVKLTVREVHSKNALPPLAVGNPDGASMRVGYPVFEFGPNWIRGLETSYLRYGTEQREGRRLFPSVEGERAVLQTEWNMTPLTRDEFFFVAGFFDSRRGRSRAFWVIDRHDTFTPISNLSNVVFVEPLGEYSDFEEFWLDQNVGLGFVMDDGSVQVAGVFSVNDNGSTWALTIDPGQSLPSIDMSRVVRFGRARLSRFATDAMRETWHTTEVCEIRLRTIETPNEKSVEF